MVTVDVEEHKGILDYLLRHYEKLESMERRLASISGSEMDITRIRIWRIALGGLIAKYRTLIDDLSRGGSLSVIIDACKLRDDVNKILSEYSKEEDLIAPVRSALARIYADMIEICGEQLESL